MTPLKLAFLNLSRRKIPTLIAITAIAISVACSGILLRLNLLSENRFKTLGKGGDSIVAAKAGGIEIILSALNGEGEYPDYLPYKLFESLKAGQQVNFEDGAKSQPSYIRSIIPFVYFGKYGKFRAVGTDESFLKRPEGEDSPLLLKGRWASGTNEAVLGSTIAAHDSLKIDDFIQVTPWAGEKVAGGVPVKFKVTGIFEQTSSAWDRMLFTNVSTAQNILSSMELRQISIWGHDVLNYFLIYLQPNGFTPLSALINKRTVGQAVLVTEQIHRLENLTGTGKTIGLFVTILILTLSGLSVTAMLVTRFEAMSTQLAVLRALGYKKKIIGQWLLWEGFLLGLGACCIGISLDLCGFPLMRSVLSDTLPASDIVQSSIFQSFPIWITAIAATTVSVFIPLYRVYHQDIHFSLRN
jgi:putative ABC transport system permease protein